MENIKFTRNHMWIREKEDLLVIGISDYAQMKLKSIMFVTLPEIGENLVQNETSGATESNHTDTALIAPGAGKLREINAKVVDIPEQMNESPYESWLIKISPNDFNDFYSSDFMSEENYKEYIKSL